jgi:hypothetical protein
LSDERAGHERHYDDAREGELAHAIHSDIRREDGWARSRVFVGNDTNM